MESTMKLSSLILICLFFSFIGYANATCNTALTSDDRYEQLNTALKCLSSENQALSSRIQVLEEWKTIKTQELEKLQAKQKENLVLATETATSSLGQYSDDTFDVILKSCVKNRNTVECILKYENISNTDIAIDIRPKETQLFDNNGELWSYHDNTALVVSGWTTIPQKKYTTTKITFKGQGNTEGKVFNLFIVNGFSTGGSFKIVFNNFLI